MGDIRVMYKTHEWISRERLTDSHVLILTLNEATARGEIIFTTKKWIYNREQEWLRNGYRNIKWNELLGVGLDNFNNLKNLS